MCACCRQYTALFWTTKHSAWLDTSFIPAPVCPGISSILAPVCPGISSILAPVCFQNRCPSNSHQLAIFVLYFETLSQPSPSAPTSLPSNSQTILFQRVSVFGYAIQGEACKAYDETNNFCLVATSTCENTLCARRRRPWHHTVWIQRPPPRFQAEVARLSTCHGHQSRGLNGQNIVSHLISDTTVTMSWFPYYAYPYGYALPMENVEAPAQPWQYAVANPENFVAATEPHGLVYVFHCLVDTCS